MLIRVIAVVVNAIKITVLNLIRGSSDIPGKQFFYHVFMGLGGLFKGAKITTCLEKILLLPVKILSAKIV